MTDLTVIVATYNRPDALDAALRALAGQSDRDFEIVVADDGSGEATAAVVAAWGPRLPVPLRHVWQEDRGFRLAEIRNRAILQSSGEICVFLDGDCLARRDFVAAHRRLAAPNWFVAGNRILLSPVATQRILSERLAAEDWGAAAWMSARRRGDINRLAPLARLPLGPLRRLTARRWEGARGCNIAVRREDLLRVDGFDAAVTGWGLEDSDLVIRLLRAGCRRKDGRFATGVLHLWHREQDRSQFADNRRRLDTLLASDRLRAERGLSALAAAAPQTDRAGAVVVAAGGGHG